MHDILKNTFDKLYEENSGEYTDMTLNKASIIFFKGVFGCWCSIVKKYEYKTSKHQQPMQVKFHKLCCW